MIVLAFKYDRERCGVSDFTNHLYPGAACLGPDIEVRRVKVSLWNCLRAPFAGADVVHLQHEYSLLGFAGCQGFLLLLYWQLLRLTGTRLVVTLHTVYDWDRTAEIFAHRTKSRLVLRLLGIYGQVYHWLLLHTARVVIFVGESSRVAFAAKNRVPPGVRLVTIPIGVYESEIPELAIGNRQSAISPEWNIAPGDFVLTLFGFAYPNKGYHLAIEAVAKLQAELPRLRLLVVSGEPAEGGKSYLAELQALAARRGLDACVKFTGYLPADDPQYAEVLRRTDCFLYPYLQESATSGSLATTLVARKLYVTSDLKMFAAFTAGIKFRAGDVSALAEVIRRVVKMSAADVAAYRGRLDEYIASHGVSATRQQHAEVFRELMK